MVDQEFFNNLKLLEKLARIKMKFRRKAYISATYNYLCKEIASTVAKLEVQKYDIAKTMADADCALQTLDGFENGVNEQVLELERGITRRFQLLQRQAKSQKYLIRVEKKRFRKLYKTLEKVDKKRDRWRDKFLSIVNAEGFKEFLTVGLDEILEL